MPKIRVLIYTDRHDPVDASKNMVLEPADPRKAPFGLSLMRDLILTHIDKGIEVEIDLINRNIPCHAAQKITRKLLEGYEELWVFGQFQVNVAGEYKVTTGGPNNEFDASELKAICDWMDKGGGVLITGDHSEGKPKMAIGENLNDLLNLGRALGHAIPRAGEMRAWEGGPTTNIRNSFNTQSPGPFTSIDCDKLEKDGEPQHIILEPDKVKFPLGSKVPHELFAGGPGNRILVFPDHTHEGKLLIPKMNSDVWPKGAIAPFVVAKGFDKRFCPFPVRDLVSVYDGHAAKVGQIKVGRIVADSSWHHYLNLNLVSLRYDPCDITTPRHQIGKYYANLVRWLAPPSIQAQLPIARIFWFATHPRVLEAADSDPRFLGKTVRQVIEMECQPSEELKMLESSIPQKLIDKPHLFDYIPVELRLGTLIKESLNAIEKFGNDAEQKLIENEKVDALFTDAFKQSLKIQMGDLIEQESKIYEASNSLPGDSLHSGSSESTKQPQNKENNMAKEVPFGDWKALTIGADTHTVVLENMTVIEIVGEDEKVNVRHSKHSDPTGVVPGTIDKKKKTINFEIHLATGAPRWYAGTWQELDSAAFGSGMDAVIIGKYSKTEILLEQQSEEPTRERTDDDGGWVAIRPPGQ